METNLVSEIFKHFEFLSSAGLAAIAYFLHKFFVKQKNDTIKLLEVTNTDLKYRLEQSQKLTPDILATSLTTRVKNLADELERLQKDKGANQEEIISKEKLLAKSKQDIESLTNQIADAQKLLSEYLCPHCQSPMNSRVFHSESVEHNGREFDVEHEFVEYICGYVQVDGVESKPCEKHNPSRP